MWIKPLTKLINMILCEYKLKPPVCKLNLVRKQGAIPQKQFYGGFIGLFLFYIACGNLSVVDGL